MSTNPNKNQTPAAADKGTVTKVTADVKVEEGPDKAEVPVLQGKVEDQSDTAQEKLKDVYGTWLAAVVESPDTVMSELTAAISVVKKACDSVTWMSPPLLFMALKELLAKKGVPVNEWINNENIQKANVVSGLAVDLLISINPEVMYKVFYAIARDLGKPEWLQLWREQTLKLADWLLIAGTGEKYHVQDWAPEEEDKVKVD
jgi:hypothetical protein